MATITKAELAKLEDALEGMGVYEIRKDYSGRFMYGRQCVGVVVNDGDVTLLALAFAAALGNDPMRAADFFADARQDNMGHSRIVYFPGLEADDDDADDEG